jgi:hypothetical protein
MRGYYKVDNELHNRPCVRAAKHDPMTRQCASLWAAILSLAKEANNGGRLEHDGGPFTLDEMAEHCGIVVPAECVTRDVTDRHVSSRVTERDVTLACVTLYVERWGWAEWDGEVLVVKSWGAWYGEDEEKLAQKREKDRERAARYRRNHRSTVTRDVTQTSRVTSRDENVTSRPGAGSGSGTGSDQNNPPNPPRGEAGESDPGESPKPERKKRQPTPEPELPEWLPVGPWESWCAMRRAGKGGAKFTADARALAIRTLANLRAQGQDPARVLEQSVFRGWSGLFPVRDDGPPRPGGGAAAGGQGGLEEWMARKNGEKA